MKFGKQMQQQLIPEWRKRYFDYKEGKKRIKATIASLEEEKRRAPAFPSSTQNEPSSSGGSVTHVMPLSRISGPTSPSRRRSFAVSKPPEYKVPRCTLKPVPHTNRVTVVPEEDGVVVNSTFHAFFEFADNEVMKVNEFYLDRHRQNKTRLTQLKRQIDALKSGQHVPNHIGFSASLKDMFVHHNVNGENQDQHEGHMDEAARAKYHKTLKRAFIELFKAQTMLQNYCTLNFTAIVKIMKKFDKYAEQKCGSEYVDLVRSYQFVDHEDLIINKKLTLQLFADEYYNGSTDKAQKRMDEAQVLEKEQVWPAFILGLCLGISIPVLIAAATYASDPAVLVQIDRIESLTAVMATFRWTFLFILFSWGYALNIFMWTRVHVNWKFIFDHDLHNHLTPIQAGQAASILTLAWSGCAWLYLRTLKNGGSGEYDPYIQVTQFIDSRLFMLAFILAIIVFILWPTRHLFYGTRRWLLSVFLVILSAPFTEVVFRDFFIADQMNSAVIIMQDMELSLCYIVTDYWSGGDVCTNQQLIAVPIISCMPAYFRFMQCLRRYYDTKKANPHLINAGKYLSALLVVLFSTLNLQLSGAEAANNESYNQYRIMWILAAVFNTCYATYWDFVRDWGLFKPGAQYKFLRNELLYGTPLFYYWAMVSNLFGRLMWIFALSPDFLIFNPVWFRSVVGLVSVLRRIQWNLLRLENEQLANAGEFRVTKHVPLPFDIEEDEEGFSNAHASNRISLPWKRKSKAKDNNAGSSDKGKQPEPHAGGYGKTLGKNAIVPVPALNVRAPSSSSLASSSSASHAKPMENEGQHLDTQRVRTQKWALTSSRRDSLFDDGDASGTEHSESDDLDEHNDGVETIAAMASERESSSSSFNDVTAETASADTRDSPEDTIDQAAVGPTQPGTPRLAL